MKKYSTYSTEDFLSDERFLEWVLSPSGSSIEYWKTVFILHPACESKADEAKKIVSALQIKHGETMPRDMRREILMYLQTQVDKTPTENESKRAIRPWKYFAAACILACCFTALFLYRGLSPSPSTSVDLVIEQTETANSDEKKITNTASQPLLLILPDTSTVILEANAYVIYDEKEFTENRVIYLWGEAFFEVTSSKDHPFFVKTDHLTTQVLGTSFRVKAAKTLAESKVSVQSGVVEVRKKTQTGLATKIEAPVYLIANQEIKYTETTSEQPSSTSTPTTISIPSFDEDFKSEPLKSVLKTLSDQYKVDISIADSVLETRTITASLQNIHLFEKLTLISKAAEATYHIVDGRIIFKPHLHEH
ncbi:FecR family protein [Parapedobacter sp.]